MLKIRLKRSGKKRFPSYKIVLSESLKKRDGKSFLEIGFYNPYKKFFSINKKFLIKYLSFGATPTNIVQYLISQLIY